MKISYANRSAEKELLDRDDIPFEDIERNMHELDLSIPGWGGTGSASEG
jgi:hypothetical protein